MPRPNKKGLEYFPLDVDIFSDDKLKYVRARFDEKGELITIKLLCEIYRNGYCTEWSEDKSLIFSDSAGKNITANLANDVVHELVKRDFFDRGIFDRFGLLTSAGIQRRFLEASKKRKNIEITTDHWLIALPKDTSDTTFLITVAGNPVNDTRNPVNDTGNDTNKTKVNNNSFSSEPNSDGEKFDEEKTENPKQRHREKNIYEHESKYYKTAAWLAKNIENEVEGYKPHTETQLQSWADIVRLIVEVDKRDTDTTRSLLIYARTDEFWKKNILSMGKFRKQYDQLLTRYQAEE